MLINKHLYPLSLRLSIYSQCGNVMFPAWECFIPSMGTIFLLHRNCSVLILVDSFICYS